MAASTLQRKRQQGFTLMELVISVVLLGILSVVGANMIAGSFFTTRVISNEHLANAMARYAMERMAREIREISYDTSTGTLGVTVMQPSQLGFNKSGLGGTVTAISFSHTSPTLTMSMAGNTTPLATDITAFGLTYLDANEAITAMPGAVRHVRITLTASPAQAQPITLVTQVRLRNV
jgi:prepilin-type N-terminal cleavage/methylation domain-containing protein